MPLILEGITVIDVSQVAAVPIAARHLADFGANVIHIEHPVRGDSWRTFQPPGISEKPYLWENYNRNKRSLSVDVSREQGQDILYRLAARADVFLTNLRLWEREKYHLTYADVKVYNPAVIYGSLTGHGKKGPDRNKPAYDAGSYWARSGLQYLLTTPGLPPPAPRGAIGDNMAGLGLAFGIMLALYHRERTGVGQEVDVSLLQMGVYQATFDIAGALVCNAPLEEKLFPRLEEDDASRKRRDGLMADVGCAMSRLEEYYREKAPNPLALQYKTSDGRTLSFMPVLAARNWTAVSHAIGREDLEDDPRFSTVEAIRENKAELHVLLKEAIAQRTLAEWRDRLAGLPYVPHQSVGDVLTDPQALANRFFTDIDHPTYGQMKVLANPVNLSETPASIGRFAPEFAQHTEEVLLETGYEWDQIAAFKEAGIIT